MAADRALAHPLPALSNRSFRPTLARLRPGLWGMACLGLLLGVLGIYLAIGWATPGDQADMENGKIWIRWLTRNGVQDAYRMAMDYPPVPLYLFALAGTTYQALVDPTFNEKAALASQTLTLLWKLPGIGFQLLLAALIYVLVRPHGPRVAFLAAASYALNPAVAYDVPHLGQTDPVPAAFGVAGAGALVTGWPALAGAALALAALSKPQAWVLLPLGGWILLRWYGMAGLVRAALTGGVTGLVVLAPWILGDRLHHLPRFLGYLSTRSTANTAISADAHNLWWLPTLARSEWIDDWQPLLGPVSYRIVGLALAATWLGLCLVAAGRIRRREDLYLVAGALAFGFFMLMVRAHENHSALAIPLLLLATACDRRRWPFYALATVGLLLNLALHDPLLIGAYASPPAPGQPYPPLALTGQLLNLGLNLALLALLARWLLDRAQDGRPRPDASS